MMGLHFLIVFAMYVLAGTVIAVLSRRMGVKSAKDYYIAGGRVGFLVAFGTYMATTYSAFMMIGLVGLTYQTGIGAYGFELLYLLVTVILLSTIGYSIWRYSRERGWISPAQMIGDLYGSTSLSKIISIIYLISMIPYVAAQIQGLGAIFEISGLSYTHGVLLGAIIVISWIAMAGMWSVATTDLYQAFIMLAGGLLYFYSVYSMITSRTSLNHVLRELGKAGYLGITEFWNIQVFMAYTIPWIFFAITNPQVVVRLYIHRDSSSYRRSLVVFAISGFLYTLLSIGIGLLARSMAIHGLIPSNIARDKVTPTILGMINPFVSSIIAVSIVAAAVSTANSIILAVSSSLFKDLLITKSEKRVHMISIDIALVLIIALIAYFRVGYIVDLSVLTSVLLIPLAPLTIVGVALNKYINKYSRVTGIISVIAGFSIGMYSFITMGAARTFIAAYYGLPISAWILVLSSIILMTGLLIDMKKPGKHVGN
ncbi:MAG: sodium:solute symporter family protein [Desulfurococcaceae archaeon]